MLLICETLLYFYKIFQINSTDFYINCLPSTYVALLENFTKFNG